MAFANLQQGAATPRQSVLSDCLSTLGGLQRVIENDGLEGAAARAGWLRRIHTSKGAVGFLGLGDLSSRLHRLEGLVSAFDPSLKGKVSDLLDEAALQAKAGLAEPVVRSPETSVRRFGETLWWANELVHGMAADCGKTVFLLVHGGDITTDEVTGKALETALQHLVRNAVVHGIEMPDTRFCSGKPMAGLITIRASSDEAGLRVSVQDNGQGMDQHVLQQALEPGFSTAITPSEHAGRGLGLPICREAVEAAGGSFSVSSSPGDGTRFDLLFPSAICKDATPA